jgi:hypothetical protein
MKIRTHSPNPPVWRHPILLSSPPSLPPLLLYSSLPLLLYSLLLALPSFLWGWSDALFTDLIIEEMLKMIESDGEYAIWMQTKAIICANFFYFVGLCGCVWLCVSVCLCVCVQKWSWELGWSEEKRRNARGSGGRCYWRPQTGGVVVGVCDCQLELNSHASIDTCTSRRNIHIHLTHSHSYDIIRALLST